MLTATSLLSMTNKVSYLTAHTENTNEESKKELKFLGRGKIWAERINSNTGQGSYSQEILNRQSCNGHFITYCKQIYRGYAC
jgi:hypothetical protein